MPINHSLGDLASYAGSAAALKSLNTIGPNIEALLRSVRLNPKFDGAVPIPGLYALMSGAGGGKSTLCRELDSAIRDMFDAVNAPAIEYDMVTCGEPENPVNTFEYVFARVMKYLVNRRAGVDRDNQTAVPAILIVDSFSDLGFQEIPRAPRSSGKDIAEMLSADGAKALVQPTATPNEDIPCTMLDLAVSKSSLMMTPNTAALSGGLTGSYYQILKRLSVLATHKGVYMFTVINPLTFDDRTRFRDAVSGSVVAALSIDQQATGLARCVEQNESGSYDFSKNVRKAITNDRLSVSSEEISDMFTAMLNGGM